MAHVLTTKWNDLTEAEREQALREAFEWGSVAAAGERQASRGEEVAEVRTIDYCTFVVHVLLHEGSCTEAEKDYFESGEAEVDDDPRIPEFMRGWRECLQSRQEAAPA